MCVRVCVCMCEAQFWVIAWDWKCIWNWGRCYCSDTWIRELACTLIPNHTCTTNWMQRPTIRHTEACLPLQTDNGPRCDLYMYVYIYSIYELMYLSISESSVWSPYVCTTVNCNCDQFVLLSYQMMYMYIMYIHTYYIYDVLWIYINCYSVYKVEKKH